MSAIHSPEVTPTLNGERPPGTRITIPLDSVVYPAGYSNGSYMGGVVGFVCRA